MENSSSIFHFYLQEKKNLKQKLDQKDFTESVMRRLIPEDSADNQGYEEVSNWSFLKSEI